MTARALCLVTAVLLSAESAAHALPETRTASDTVDDATITLTVLSQYIRGDSRSFCSVRIEVGSSAVAFSDGDDVYIWVWEDDLAGDDEIWATSFVVEPAEVAAGAIDRTFDCSAAFPEDDTGDYIEVYAEARVEKALCGTWCVWDRPETANIHVLAVDDDGDEEDDSVDVSTGLLPGLSADRVARDSDWVSFELLEPAAIEARALYLPSVGRLDVFLQDDGGSDVGASTDSDEGTVVVSGVVSAGTYYVNIWPRSPPDFNFYDLQITLTPADCVTGEEESRPCGDCGAEVRRCVDGAWEAWSECGGEGECAPGDEQTVGCGNCGLERSVCNAECAWETGDCEGEGVCRPGTTQTEACSGGSRENVCGDDCRWEQGECVPDPVDDGGPDDGGPDDGGPDDGGPDGGLPDGGSGGGGSGCSCRATGGGASGCGLLLLLAALLAAARAWAPKER